jgi:hypothetical protein
VEIYLHTFFYLGTRWGEWSASCPGHFTPRERAPGIHWIGGWVGLRAGPDMVVKRTIFSPYQDWNPLVHPAHSPALYHRAIPAPAFILRLILNIYIHRLYMSRGESRELSLNVFFFQFEGA